jgi:ATP-binding cassette, subfamily C (CFTR/MRP), member 1
LIIVENGRVTYQGPPSGIGEDAAHFCQTYVNAAVPEPSDDFTEVNKTIQSQALEVSEAMADLGRSTGDFSLYGIVTTPAAQLIQYLLTGIGYYLRAVKPRNFFLLLNCTASYSFFVTFPQYWLQKWTESPAAQTRFYVGGYIILSLLAWAATNGSMW